MKIIYDPVQAFFDGIASTFARTILALAAFLSFLILAYQFLDTTKPKAVFLVLYAIGFVYFVPLTWDDQFTVWKALASGLGFVIFYIIFAYVLPWIVPLVFVRSSEKELHP